MKIKHILNETSVTYTNKGPTTVRKLNIPQRLYNIIQAAGKQAGIDRIEIFSGGQVPIGQKGPRTGSIRHDINVGAADVYLYAGGKQLSTARPDPRVAAFIQAARALGAVGIGAGPGYMESIGIHVGFGKPAVWGKGGIGDNAPSWVKAAYNAGASGQAPATPATAPSASNQSAPQSNMLTQGPPYKNNNKVAKMQTYLENLGYSVGSTGIDGKYGWRTAKAVAAFKKDYGLQGDGSTWSKAETAKLNLIDKKPNLRVKPTQVNLDSNSEDNQNLVSIESLGTMRQRFVKELQDPQFLEIVLALTISEVGFTNQAAQRAFLETLMNRSLAYNKTMRAWVLGSRYYHPMNDRRIINRRLNSIRTDKELRARVMNSLRDVLAGSNDSNLALHNGSANIAVRAKKQGTVRATIGGETFYNKTNPAGDAYYGGGYSGVRNTEAKFVQQFEKAIDNENK